MPRMQRPPARPGAWRAPLRDPWHEKGRNNNNGGGLQAPGDPEARGNHDVVGIQLIRATKTTTGQNPKLWTVLRGWADCKNHLLQPRMKVLLDKDRLFLRCLEHRTNHSTGGWSKASTHDRHCEVTRYNIETPKVASAGLYHARMCVPY